MLSIIIPTFNEEKQLASLLETIKSQSFTNYEVIVADNNSTDNTIEIAKQYGALTTSGGLPGKGRNCGADVASGQFILFLDADVRLTDPNFLRDIVAEFNTKGYGVATCQVSAISNRKIDAFMHGCYNCLILLTAKFRPFAPGFCIIARREVHDIINGFDEEIMLGEDSDYVLRASKITKFGVLGSQRINVSVRRFDRDGRWNVAIKYILSGIYVCLFGNIKSNIFNYTFGHK
jgi:glycosyltransferase involved in cell wall biosynthesis